MVGVSKHTLGCSQRGGAANFLKEPPRCIQPNAPMDDKMGEAAADFIEEFMDLGVVGSVDKGLEILCKAPMFVVPKPVNGE
mmetsp:Transcript_14789/g.22587  ORF Transcript_14789/g.22587 Transcript_14789/m.22587 type:complete len:81 (-) Transcript_14789:2061-2303(-)